MTQALSIFVTLKEVALKKMVCNFVFSRNEDFVLIEYYTERDFKHV
jgi:hypothetical protein